MNSSTGTSSFFRIDEIRLGGICFHLLSHLSADFFGYDSPVVRFLLKQAAKLHDPAGLLADIINTAERIGACLGSLGADSDRKERVIVQKHLVVCRDTLMSAAVLSQIF